MRKFLSLMIAVLMAVFAFGQSYGILVNGHTYFAGTHVDDFGGYTQYLAHVQVAAGDYCQLYDATNEAAWAVDLDQATIDGFTRNNDRYEVSVSGCYDFYIKMKYGSDQLYIGAGSNCGAGEEIGGGESDQMYVWNGVGVTSADDAIELGGAAEAVQADGTNIAVGVSQKGNWCLKANKGFNNGAYYLGIALDNAVNAGDTIKIAYFRTTANNTYVMGMDFSADKASAATTYQILTQGDPQVLSSNGVPADSIFIVPAGVSNAKYIRIYRNSGGTGLWVAKFEIAKKSGETPEPEPVDPKTGYALLVNGTDTIDLEHADPFEEYDQWFTDAAELHAGDVVKVYNYDTQAAWAIGILNPASSSYVSNSENGLVFSKDSIYTIYLKLKYELDEVYVAPFDNEGGEVPPVVEDAKFYIAGTMTEWAANMVELVAGNGDTLSVSIPLEANSLYEFKVVRVQGTDTAWYGAGMDATMHYGNSTDWSLYGDVDVKLQTTKADDYLFIFRNNEAKNISVVIPEPCMGKYGIMLGETFVPAKLNEAQEAWTEYYIDSLELAAGATFTLYDSCALAAWIVNPAYMDEAYAFDTVGAKYTVTMDGIYNLYIKLIPGADELFVNNLSYVAPEPCNGKYGIMLGETFVPAKLNEAQTEWLEYAIEGVELAEGDMFQLYDSCNAAAWIVNAAYNNDAYAFAIDTVGGAKWAVTMAGTYNLYIKLIPNADELYVWNTTYVADTTATEECNGKYGILLNNAFVPAAKNEAQEQWLEYAIEGIELAEGDMFQLYDSCNAAAWIVNAAYNNDAYAFNVVENKWEVTVAGTYNLYIKLIPNADELYVINTTYVAPEPEKHYMVYGEAAIANGENWNENSDINVMTTTDGGLTYTLTIEGLPLQALPRVYEFKIIEKGNNGIEYFPRRYGANASFHVEEAGIYTITYIYTVATENCVVDLQKTGDFEPTLANGYYLVGDFAGVASWNPVAERMFAVNPDNEAEMVLAAVELAADDSIKVVYVENDNIVTWYPVDAPNYVVDANHAGVKDIYFRADYQGAEDWFYGCIYIAANEGMAIINTEAEKVAVKQLRNGMVIIRRGERTYTVMGQMVK